MIRWACLYFNELSLEQLYAMGRLRQEVFVVEQDCPYIDFDNKDQECWHVMCWKDDEMVGYTRIVPVGVSYPNDISIGRVITSQLVRRSGLGKELMERSIDYCYELFDKPDIRISAQDYLLHFYASFGFEDTGIKYLEDGIPHSEMFMPYKDR